MNPLSRGVYLSLLTLIVPTGFLTCPIARAQLALKSRLNSPSISTMQTVKREGTIAFGWTLRARSLTVENLKRRYSIKGQYPQIQSTTDRRALEFNREITLRIADQYRRFTMPNPRELRRRIHDMPEIEILDTAEFDYEILFSSRQFLSIRFHDTTYSFPEVHDQKRFFTLNYDLRAGRTLTLGSVFKPKANFYPRLVDLCASELGVQTISHYYNNRSLDPLAHSYLSRYLRRHEQWNLTRAGLVFNFDQCTIAACGDGELSVTIPYRDLKNLLSARILYALSK